jgi:FkbM family methyltransferase
MVANTVSNLADAAPSQANIAPPLVGVGDLRVHSKGVSRILLWLARAAEFPMRIRLFNLMHRLAGSKRIRVDIDGGGAMAVDVRDLIQRTILFSKIYEPEVVRALTPFWQRAALFLDIGANVGSISLVAQQFLPVHAFEPDPNNRAVLQLNASLGQQTFPLTVHADALGDCAQTLALRLAGSGNRGLSSFVETVNSCATVDVNVLTLDQAMPALEANSVWKIDVEGFEEQVLIGSAKTFERAPPIAIVFEDVPSPNSSCKMKLSEYGYVISAIERDDKTRQTRENFLAIRPLSE